MKSTFKFNMVQQKSQSNITNMRKQYQNGAFFYVGEFTEGLRNGWGTYQHVNFDFWYEGEWKDDVKHGVGILVENGRRTEGFWMNDSLHGECIVYEVDGRRYEGKFVDGKRNGMGTWYLKGQIFSGEWRNGLKHGLGKSYRANGVTFESNYVHNIQLGICLVQNPDGRYIKGNFKNGTGEGISYGRLARDGLKRHNYEGQFVRYCPDGKGTEYMPNGDSFEGNFRSGVQDGKIVYQCSQQKTRLTQFYRKGKLLRGKFHRMIACPASSKITK